MSKKGVYKVCMNCGEQFYVRPSRAQVAKFCSRVCADAQHKGRPGKQIIVVCEICGEEFSVSPSRLGARFCSKGCYGESKKGRSIGILKGYRRRKVQKICEQCGAIVFVSISRAKRFRFCSVACTAEWRQDRSLLSVRSGEIIVCEVCGKEFYVNAWQAEHGRRFCSKECRGKWLGEKQRGNAHPGWNSEERKCKVCGKSFFIHASELKKGKQRGGEYGQYCSRDCQSEYQVGEDSPAWKGGLSFLPYSPEFNNRLKRQVRERDNDLCVRCGRPGVDVHHVDYDKENNSLDNLVLLCKSCHGQTNFEREMWVPVFQWHIAGEPKYVDCFEQFK